MTQRVQHAIDVFLDSLNNNTLVSGTCVACAVGNLVADAFGIKLTSNRSESNATVIEVDDYCPKELGGRRITTWSNFFLTPSAGEQDLNLDGEGLDTKSHKAMDTICKKTGFTVKELADIEYAFETNCNSEGNMVYWDDAEKQAQYIKGLTAVVKVMMEFDSIEEEVEEVFTKKAEAIFA
jgi:hypothetical protein